MTDNPLFEGIRVRAKSSWPARNCESERLRSLPPSAIITRAVDREFSPVTTKSGTDITPAGSKLSCAVAGGGNSSRFAEREAGEIRRDLRQVGFEEPIGEVEMLAIERHANGMCPVIQSGSVTPRRARSESSALPDTSRRVDFAY